MQNNGEKRTKMNHNSFMMGPVICSFLALVLLLNQASDDDVVKYLISKYGL